MPTRSASACPRQARALVAGALANGIPVGVHLHDTRNTAVACAWAAVEAGATVLDGSVGGVGGCPFAPRATGNVATEDLVYLLEREGVDTGVDLDALIAVAEWLARVLGRDLPGRVYRAGGFPRRGRAPPGPGDPEGSLLRRVGRGFVRLERRQVTPPRLRHAVRRQPDEEHGGRRLGLARKRHRRLLEQPVTFAQVARRAGGDDVLPDGIPAARARHHVVEREPMR